METRSGFFVVGSKEGGGAAKVAKNYDESELCLRMQASKESCTHKKRPMVMMSSHDDEQSNISELSSSSSTVVVRGSGSGSAGAGFNSGFGPDCGAAVGGSFFCSSSNNINNRVACFGGDIYDVVGASANSNVIEGLSKSVFSFNSLSPFNSTGEMSSSVNMRVPFTASQLQELERQTMIYKCMMASIPVPPELLIPITKHQPNALASQSNSCSLELGIPGCNPDPEPWRCKRTDGKKWRCSRDVAPDQKYCERHSHKSRPRSRKPVELHNESIITTTTTTNNSNYGNPNTNTNLPNKKSHLPSEPNCHLSMFPGAMASAAAPAPSSYHHDQPRGLEWFLRGETIPFVGNSIQEWKHLKSDSIKGGEKEYDFRAIYRQEEQLNSNSYMNLGGSHSLQAQRLNDQCSLLFSPNTKSSSLEAALNHSQTQAQETRHFLDAWSTAVREDIGGIGNNTTVNSNDKLLPLSSLTLSMSGGSETDEENENALLGSFGIMGSDTENVGGNVLRPQWMTHGSWMGSPPGGPLAEALCLGISSGSPKAAASNLSSPHGSSCGTPANTS